MSSLVQDDLTRATTFFALAFGFTTLVGLVIGDLRLGVEWGLALGLGFAVFAYFFVAPTALDEDSGLDTEADEAETVETDSEDGTGTDAGPPE